MKAYSCGLETRISKLTEEEIESLRKTPIKGELKFREPASGNEKRKIPFILNYNPLQREFVKIKITPEKTYFGDATLIEFFINQEYYNSLKKNGISLGARFCFGAGKLGLTSEKIKYS